MRRDLPLRNANCALAHFLKPSSPGASGGGDRFGNPHEVPIAATPSRVFSFRPGHLQAIVLAILTTTSLACRDADESYDALEARLEGKTVASSFTADAEGWRVTDASRRVSLVPSLTQTGPADEAYLAATNYWEEWYWRAPAAFHGNLCAYYGGHVSFRMRQWVNALASPGGELFESTPGALESMPGGLLILEGRGSQLIFQLPRLPGTEWTTFEVPLEPGPGWRGEPSESDFMMVLANVTDFLIQGDSIQTSDVEALGAVSLTKPSWITGLFSSTSACDEQEAKKTIRLLSAQEPFEPLESFEWGMSFRVEVRFEEPPGTAMERVTVTNRSTGEEYRFEAHNWRTSDPLVYLTPVISTQIVEGSEP